MFSYARTHATLPTSSPSTILSSEATELGSSSAFGIQPGIFLLPAPFFPPFFLLSPQKSCSSFSSQVFLIGPPQTPLQTPFLSPPRSSHYSPSAFPSHTISRSLSDTFCMAAIKCLSPENIQNKEVYLVGLRPSPGNLYYLYMLWQGGAWRMWPVLGTSWSLCFLPEFPMQEGGSLSPCFTSL